SRNYWHLVRLMGRAASHITLEVALQTRPNLAIISEEAEAKGWTLKDVVDQIVAVVKRRAEAGKSYGVVVIPEGLLEFLVDVKAMIAELGIILGEHEGYLKSLTSHEDRRQFLTEKLSAESAQVYNSLPDGIQEVLLLRDKHGNIPLSQVETEKLLIDLVSDRIREMKAEGQFQGSFSPLSHFFGYEGRCVQPSNFDADYCYTLGYTAAQLIRGGVTGYTVSARNLTAPASEWVMGGVPVTSMLTVEMRKGKPKPVIRKTLVSVDGKPFLAFAAERDSWVEEDCFAYPGPIQYFGPSEVCDRLTKTLVLEHS
ncbi:MAG: diphosphate--fructose-6-phosphate 1-phosphotransferase, partial [Armatimonadota bacterium]